MNKVQDKWQGLNVTVLMGGPSSEREISLLSGQAIAEALKNSGHCVTCADISPLDTAALDRDDIDVVFIALHGDFGESGEVQKLCQSRGLKYTGSDPRASMYGMDKAASKQVFTENGLVTPDWLVVEEYCPIAETRKQLSTIDPPVVVKPVSGGSSVDVWMCRDMAMRDEALEDLLDTYLRAMVEKYVPGREFTVGILGDRVLPVIEVKPESAFYDYRSKYADNTRTRYIFEHGLDEHTVLRLQNDAMTAHRSLGCRDFSRVDFIVDQHGNPYVLEINTIPGFTSHSLLPKAAMQAGIGFTELCDMIVQMAMSHELVPEMILG